VKVFVSYSTALDQIVALRLQTMAAVYGLTVYVPPATSRHTMTAALSPEVQRNLQDADVVLAVIMHSPVPSAISEIDAAIAQGKLLIPIVSQGVPQHYYAQFPHFIVDPGNPAQAERDIVHFLAEKQQAKTSNHAILALATLAVALLMFGAAESTT
jgi:hypothetical protein